MTATILQFQKPALQHDHEIVQINTEAPEATISSPCLSPRRPRTLVAAARAGLPNYRRCRDLPRVIRDDILPRPGSCVGTLAQIENHYEAARLDRLPSYNYARHVFVAIALLAERRLSQRPRNMDPSTPRTTALPA